MNDIENLEELKEQQSSLCRKVENLQEQCQRLQQDNIHLRAEKEVLQEKIRHSELNEHFFKNNVERVHYYTGLTSWNLLLIVIQFVQPFLNVCGWSSLLAFQQVIMILMRLCVGLRTRFWISVWDPLLYGVTCIHYCY